MESAVANKQLDPCPACLSGQLKSGLAIWHRVCCDCCYECSDLDIRINAPDAQELLNETTRLSGLESVRKTNFKLLCETLKLSKTAGGKLLDVGAAHGWFLDEARPHFRTFAIEPDKKFEQALVLSGHQAKIGFFPDVLETNELFDVIVFNDVFEHIPNTSLTLDACRKHLNNEGLLLINCPSSSGIVYRIARTLKTLRVDLFFSRMWQTGLPSPHVHYFNPRNLETLLKNHGFTVTAKGRLVTLARDGLKERITYTGSYSPLFVQLICWCALALMPIFRLLPPDIIYCIARKTPSKQ